MNGYKPLEVKGRGVGLEGTWKDNPALSEDEEMVVRQAVQLTVEIVQPRHEHDTDEAAKKRNESVGSTRGICKEISFEGEAGK